MGILNSQSLLSNELFCKQENFTIFYITIEIEWFAKVKLRSVKKKIIKYEIIIKNNVKKNITWKNVKNSSSCRK